MRRVLGAGRKFQPRGYVNQIRDYPQFMVLIVRRGELVVDVAGVPESVIPTGVVVLTPGVDVRLSTPRSAYHGLFVEGVPDDCDLPRAVHRFAADAGILQTVADLEYELAHPAADDPTPALAQLLLARCARRCRPVAPRAPAALIAEQVERLLRANLYRQAPLAEILAPLPIGRRQLARIFRDQRGTTIKRAQLALKIAEARTLLRNPQFSVTGVAFDLGFPSSQHFATAFKALVGAPPGVWRISAGRDAPATPVDDR